MSSLTDWSHMSRLPEVIESDQMTIVGHDFDIPLVIGKGRFRNIDSGKFEYEMTGKAPDIRRSLSYLKKISDNPYRGDLRCRLMFDSRNGEHFSGGWTIPHVQPIEGGQMGDLRCHGSSEELWIGGLPGASEKPAMDVQMSIPRGRRSFFALARFVGNGHRIDILGTRLEFDFDQTSDVLRIRAEAVDGFNIPFAENWLAEPLRIMFRELIYPRLVIRDFGNGRADVCLRAVADARRLPVWAGMWRGERYLADKAAFWDMYANLLTHVASGKETDGTPLFEANNLTQHYEEIIQAAVGSRRVWALNLASTVEALVLELFPRGSRDQSADEKAIDELVDYIGKWKGTNDLKAAAAGAVRRKAEMSAAKALARLRKEGAVNKAGVDAWNSIRNKVMHGSLISIYSDEREDDQILALMELVHVLAERIVSVAPPSDATTPTDRIAGEGTDGDESETPGRYEQPGSSDTATTPAIEP